MEVCYVVAVLLLILPTWLVVRELLIHLGVFKPEFWIRRITINQPRP